MLQKYFTRLLFLYIVIQLFWGSYAAWDRWSEYRKDPRIAVRDAVWDVNYSSRRYLGRMFVNSNAAYVATFDYGISPIINQLVFDYESDFYNKPEVLRLIKLLADNRANVNLIMYGQSALFQAITSNQPVLVELLLNLGADPVRVEENIVGYCPSSTAIEFAMCMNTVEDRSEVIFVLLDFEEKNKLK